MKIQALTALLALPLGVLSAQAAVFERDLGRSTGNVLVLRGGARPPALQGIQLLPLDVVGRTRLGELQPGSTRRNEEVPGAARLVLPHEKGALYHYRRDEGASAFGLFLVDADGAARSLLELPGTEPAGSGDPLRARIAVAEEGSAVLVATAPTAGGDLWEIELATGSAVNRTPDVPPQDFQRGGLALLPRFGVGVSTAGVFRFAREPGARASAVRIPRVLPVLGPDVVASADGSTVAFLAGESEQAMLVFTVTASGDAAQASETPMFIPGAGFLPEEPDGPHLALSSDGSWVAWRKQGSSSECYVRETRAGAGPEQLVTGSSHFGYTLNDTGVISFFGRSSFVLAVGRHVDDGLERGDAFRVDLAPDGFTVKNLTRTSGIQQPPFDYGTLATTHGLFRLGAGAAFLGYDAARGGRLLRFDAAGACEVQLEDVQSLDALVLAGDHVVVTVTRPPGVHDPRQATLDLLQFPLAGAGVHVLRLLDARRITRTASLPSRSLFAGVVELEGGRERLVRFSVPSSNGATLGRVPRSYGATTGMASDGSLFASLEVGARQLVFSWSTRGFSRFGLFPRGSFLLPGS